MIRKRADKPRRAISVSGFAKRGCARPFQPAAIALWRGPPHHIKQACNRQGAFAKGLGQPWGLAAGSHLGRQNQASASADEFVAAG